ncbi:HD domain-containing protein [Thermococcus sibiricus]|uniref:5'-deoxynucleotidase n=1 Tax=Thermococcus sibiricus (strain DSM 12597 / MM 739) TaxID=604354 RepID=C6A517_THESM|nr:HD family hydrolase [Thermococcus sibiricus]ACS90712.1 Metal-dependent phosphohydrolase, HD superfamily [Thermococcus sibiricus MM 739]
MLKIFLEGGKLKKLPRMGWLLRGIPKPESVADHAFCVTLITLFLADELRKKGININVERALKIAILHDLAEARITDLPLDAQIYIDKKKAEKKSMIDILGAEKVEYFELFQDYEEERSIEGKLVKFADKLEMVLQAWEYEKAGFKGLEEFWNAVDYLKQSEFYEYFKTLIEEIEELKTY